jgi:hypothetical protein
MSVDQIPPDDVRRLAAFVGHWDVAGSLTAGEDSGAVTGLWKFAPTIDGWGIRVTSETSIEGLGDFTEAELIGFDPAEGKLHMFSLNRFAARDHTGSWVAEDAFSVRYNGEVDGVDVVEEINIQFVDDNHLAAHIEERNDDALAITTDLTLKRRS